MRASNARRAAADPDAPFAATDTRAAQDAQEAAWRYNIGSCHVWAADGDMVAAIRDGSGTDIEVPLSIQRRMRDLGRDPDDFRRMNV